MKSSLAIASVTVTLRDIFTQAFDGIGTAKVTSQPPGEGDLYDRAPRINVFLYQVALNAHRSNLMPTRGVDGTIVEAPSEMFDLGYLITFHGDAESLVPERLLDNTLALLAKNRVLSGDLVRQALDRARPDELRKAIAGSRLPDQRPRVALSLSPLNADALRQLWSSLFAQQAYRLSIALEASPVIVAAGVEPAKVEPSQRGGNLG